MTDAPAPDDTAPPSARPRRRRLLAVGLFLLAPFVGEYVLGNQPLTALPDIVIYAPMYGGGALLVREAARRAGAGWPAIIALGAAYALVEEGLIDQMLMNPDYLGPESFTAPIPGLGISATLTTASLSIHTAWSICVPIAIMEVYDRAEPRPWLGRTGLGVVAVVFVLGSCYLTFVQYEQFAFIASPLQLTVVGAAIVALITLAMTGLRQWGPPPRASASRAPQPRIVALAALGASSLYWIIELAVPIAAGPWASVGCWVVVMALSVLLLHRASTRPGWGREHRLAVAAGLLLTYVWAAFFNSAVLDISVALAVAGNVLIGACALIIVGFAARAERRRRADLEPRRGARSAG